MGDIIDLDALQPKAVTIKFGGNEFAFNPPQVADALSVGNAAAALDDIGSLTDEQIREKTDTLKVLLEKLCPQIKDHELGLAQLLLLVKAVSDMSMPPDAKELAKRNMSVADPKGQGSD